MPKEEEKRLEQKIYQEYRKKRYGKKRAEYIARSVVYGRRRHAK